MTDKTKRCKTKSTSTRIKLHLYQKQTILLSMLVSIMRALGQQIPSFHRPPFLNETLEQLQVHMKLHFDSSKRAYRSTFALFKVQTFAMHSALGSRRSKFSSQECNLFQTFHQAPCEHPPIS